MQTIRAKISPSPVMFPSHRPTARKPCINRIMQGPDASFWQERFERGDTPWDRGGPSPQGLAWLDSGRLAPCRIIVPGCGSGWEVAELAGRGFDVTGIDLAPAACDRARSLLKAHGLRARIEQADALDWRPGSTVDAVFEQTCLCAMHPSHWRRYARAIEGWIRPGGSLCALFMQRPRPSAVDEGRIEGPPYHCDIAAMQLLFPPGRWAWPEPPLQKVLHPAGWHELAARLVRPG